MLPADSLWKPGVSGNPGGRPKLERPPSHALVELNGTSGDTPEEVVENYRAARKKAGGLKAADHKAIALFRAESDPGIRTHVSAFTAVTDRLEGSVAQNIVAESRSFVVEVPVKLEDAQAWMDKFAPPAVLGPVEDEP